MSPGSKSKFLLVGNASYANRGCEAIIRGTMAILRKEFGDVDASAGVYGLEAENPRQNDHEADPGVSSFGLTTYPQKWTLDWLSDRVNEKLGTGFASIHKTLLPHVKDCQAVLEVGGDNYSLDYGIPNHLLKMDTFLRSKGFPVLIWGASVGPFDKRPEFAPEMFDHLRKLEAVFVRESFSKNYLAENGIEENVFLMSDPAFVMTPTDVSEARLGFEIPDRAIGLNFSPIMAKFLLKENVEVWELNEGHLAPWKQLCTDIVLKIAEQTGNPVVLVPHVGSGHLGIDDFRFLQSIFEELSQKLPGQLYCIPAGFNATEMKAIISKFHIFAGARTHSTIAALSSAVPTLSLGYSMKARGLNHDIFETQDYCVETNHMTEALLLDKLNLLLRDHDLIQERLMHRLPLIKERAFAAGPRLREVIQA